MSKLKKMLYQTTHIRQCEQLAWDVLGISEDALMLTAGKAAFVSLKKLYPDVHTIAVCCGGGNNAGDGYVLARLAHQEGFTVHLYQHKATDDLPEVAQRAALAAFEAGLCCQSLEEVMDSNVGLVVDALLGIGLKGAVREPLAHVIHVINDSGIPVFSLDIPSGLNADTGCVLGAAIRADVTLTFIAEKVGLHTMDGPDHCGELICHSLQLEPCIAMIKPWAYELDKSLRQTVFTPRRRNSHKGSYGHVLIIGGGPGMPGAVYLAALAACRVGAGSVTVATCAKHAEKMLPSLPEAMIYPMEDEAALTPLLAKASVVVVGPGLGETAWAQTLFKATMSAQLPLVIDASALRLLASFPQYDDNWVLTPHPGEAAALLHCSVKDIQSDRCHAAQQLQQQYGGCVVLKGVGSIVATDTQELFLCTAGNPGMASAGMGDVLSGIIGGLLAQGVSLANAATLGVWLHASAADEAVISQGERGLLASDLMPYLRHLVNR